MKLLALLALTFLVSSSLLFFGLSNNQRHNCEQIEKLKAQVRETIKDGNERLSKIAYYQEHPQELRDAIKDNNRIIARFNESTCNGYF